MNMVSFLQPNAVLVIILDFPWFVMPVYGTSFFEVLKSVSIYHKRNSNNSRVANKSLLKQNDTFVTKNEMSVFSKDRLFEIDKKTTCSMIGWLHVEDFTSHWLSRVTTQSGNYGVKIILGELLL